MSHWRSGSEVKRYAVLVCFSFAAFVAMAASDTSAEDSYSAWGGANTVEAGEALWHEQLAPRWFGSREIVEGASQHMIRIEAPDRAENDALVPIRITTPPFSALDTRIQKIYLSVDINPQPLAATFELSDTRPLQSIETRVRVNGYTFVRAVAELEDGRLFMDKQWVKSRGAGCSAPPGTDQLAAKSRMGNMRFKMRDNATGLGQNTLQLMISHPNNTGMQRDQLSTRIIPQHYVDDIEVTFDNELLLHATTGFSISENPSFRFDFSPQDKGLVRAKISDTKGRHFVLEQQIGPES
ncbi:MAG: quinoprotein dehydrogenase-associated SoxYZ-like carrier [Granulosicoccaceae bacterium]